MKYKLPFNIQLERKYNEINIENFLEDWSQTIQERQDRIINMGNDLHIELGKFATYGIEMNEIIDLGIRYALSKREFRNMTAELIQKKQQVSKKDNNSCFEM
ncbi:hypothetical protein [Capnocytophaga stomatis]|uniref:hypothetical protein n=1 Tax=Capnocytophaga stomatis TaxID=1848904 RepID=UPI00194EA769|nr:hypothetical protein [Capnocytophaga stomatis]